jgi:cell division protein FtsX
MVFALIHILPIRWPFALLMGLVIGYFVLLTGLVRIGIFLHALNNALTLVAMIIENQNKADLLPVLQSAYLLLALGALLWLVHKRERLFELKP